MKLREALAIVQTELVAAESRVVELKGQLGTLQGLVERYEPGGVFPSDVPEKKSHPRVATSGRKIWSVEDRKKIIEYAKIHGRKEAIEKFGCSIANLSYWVDLYVKKASDSSAEIPQTGLTFITPPTTNVLTAKQKLEICAYSIIHGVKVAADHFSVSQEHIQDWRMTRKTLEKQAKEEEEK